jgi:hypothetical protein
MMARCVVLVVVCAGLACCAAGCVAAAAGTVPAIATALETGADVYRLGKLDSADEVRYERWVAACRSGIAGLHYHVEKEADKGKGRWMCIMRDDRRSRVDITVDRRTEAFCLTRIDVGVFGSEPTARLILATIRRRAGISAASQPTSHSSDEIPEMRANKRDSSEF